MSNNKFKTTEQDKRKNSFRFVILFLIGAILIGTVSVAVLLKNNETFLTDLLSGKQTTVSEEDVTGNQIVELPQEITGQANFLIYCTNRDSSEIYFLAMVDADMEKQGFEVHPLNPDNEAYITALAKGGEKELVSAVEKAEGIEIDKYVASNTDTFALAINYMGGLEYNVDERIEYRADDYTLILTKGSQTIKGETLLKFFRYCKTLDDQEGLRQQGELICKMLDSYITTKNVEKGDTIYENVLSKIDSKSDISHIEASKALQTLKLLCESDERQPAKVILGN